MALPRYPHDIFNPLPTPTSPSQLELTPSLPLSPPPSPQLVQHHESDAEVETLDHSRKIVASYINQDNPKSTAEVVAGPPVPSLLDRRRQSCKKRHNWNTHNVRYRRGTQPYLSAPVTSIEGPWGFDQAAYFNFIAQRHLRVTPWVYINQSLNWSNYHQLPVSNGAAYHYLANMPHPQGVGNSSNGWLRWPYEQATQDLIWPEEADR